MSPLWWEKRATENRKTISFSRPGKGQRIHLPQREAAHRCQVQAEQQEVGKWGVGNLVGGEGGPRGVQRADS